MEYKTVDMISAMENTVNMRKTLKMKCDVIDYLPNKDGAHTAYNGLNCLEWFRCKFIPSSRVTQNEIREQVIQNLSQRPYEYFEYAIWY